MVAEALLMEEQMALAVELMGKVAEVPEALFTTQVIVATQA
jgi:hypothetical protein